MKLHINRQELQAAFTGNVRFTENFALRLIPVVLKNPVMALNYRLFGVRPYSCTYTNPGGVHRAAGDGCAYPRSGGHSGSGDRAALPLRLHQLRRYHGDHLCLALQAETDTERDFFRFLVREGIPVRVESNR
ncbi:MAG: hypothetical protein ACLUEU_12030 [Oscillospiraceae bacterium]